MTRQTTPPIVIRRDGVIRFYDADYGFRNRTPSEPHVRGAATKVANQRANDPLLNP